MKLILFTLLAAAMAEETSVDKLLLQGNNQFTRKMFSEVVKANPEASVVMSVFSVLILLAQLSLATEGSSHDELLRAIGMPNDNVTQEAFGIVKNTLLSVKGVDLKMASQIYVIEGHELVEEFQNISRDLFGSDVKSVDFVKNVETAGEINAWVEEQTDNHIKNLVNPDNLDDKTRAILANAIYFKGKWKKPFDKEKTINDDFYISNKKTVKVPTMSSDGYYEFGFSKELDARLLRIPYEGDKAWMLFILPNTFDGLETLKEKLKDPDSLSNATRNMFHYLCEVRLPKFKIETTTDLKQVLENIDVKKIFNKDHAQLNKILKDVSNVLYVSEAKQKAFIEVNEEGAEASAANEFTVTYRSGPIRFYANQPFYFELQAKPETSSGYITILNGVYKL